MTTKNEWWRTVLGEFPTGIAVITSTDEEGEPVGMVVGTFVAVSQEPPMVGFLPDAGSTTFPKIRANGTLSISILGSEQEPLCRAFAMKAPDRWEKARWQHSDAGNPRLADAVVWFDGRINSEMPAGDHSMVVIDVEAFGVGSGDSGSPLLYLRGGYGIFAVEAASAPPSAIHRHLRLAEAGRATVRRLAETLGADVIVSTVDRDRVVVLDSTAITTGPADGRDVSNVSFPLAAPLAPTFVAWGPADRRAGWLERSRHLVGRIDRPRLTALLDLVAERGYSVSGGSDLDARFVSLIERERAPRSQFLDFWREASEQTAELLADENRLPANITSIQAPVFDDDGSVALVLTVNRTIAPTELEQVAAQLLAACSEVTAGPDVPHSTITTAA